MCRLITTYVFLITLFCAMGTIAQTNQSFRKDYTFLPETQTFYKIHTIERFWLDAKKRCAMEGATLFYPEDVKEADVVIAYLNRTQPFYWVYIGVSDLLSKHVFETVDGIPIDDVYNRWGPGAPNDANGTEDCVVLHIGDGTLNDYDCFTKHPFICKKRLDAVRWNAFCKIPDLTYVYNATLGKCYKFHSNPLNWTDAYSVCAAEESYLAIVNSQQEADYLVNITASMSKHKKQRDCTKDTVALGFHNKFHEGWQTTKGTTLEEAGYSVWRDKKSYGDSEKLCGAMSFNGHLKDISCTCGTFFICEHDINAFNSPYNERFNT